MLSGSVWEEDGKTWLRFKKSLAGGTADHAFKVATKEGREWRYIDR